MQLDYHRRSDEFNQEGPPARRAPPFEHPSSGTLDAFDAPDASAGGFRGVASEAKETPTNHRVHELFRLELRAAKMVHDGVAQNGATAHEALRGAALQRAVEHLRDGGEVELLDLHRVDLDPAMPVCKACGYHAAAIRIGAPTPAALPLRAAVAVGGHHLRFLRDGSAAFPAMLEAIAGAAREVLLEMYWISADSIGERFRAALLERARAGVRVALVFDSFGSFETPARFWAPLIEAGVEVHEFAPLSPFRRRFRLKGLPFRDHRKILVVDGEIGFTGGINIGEPWAPPDDPASAFRDDAVELRGPAVRVLRAACLDTLRRCGSPLAADTVDTSRADALVRVLTNRIGERISRAIRRAYVVGLRKASRSIDVASAYFLPGPIFLHAMCAAARRGVRVRVLVPERSDVWIVALAMQSILGRLLAAGVEVYVYTPRVLHSKTAVFDGRSTLIGSHNLDALSLSYNLECDVVVDSAEFARVYPFRQPVSTPRAGRGWGPFVT